MSRIILKLFGLSLLTFFLGCSSHIIPQSKYYKPDLAQSKIVGKLAIYMQPNIAGMTIIGEQNINAPKHKNLLIGKGVLKMTRNVVGQVFNSAMIFDRQPTEEYLKTNGFRGLLTIDDIVTNLRLPDTSSLNSSEGKDTEMGIRINIIYTAIDFLAKQDARRKFNPDNEVIKTIHKNDRANINSILKDVSGRTLDEDADILAQVLVYMYGAR